jgi:hypothetical protein
MWIKERLILELLPSLILKHTMCSSVSVVNTLLQWYLQVFFYVSAATWPFFFTVWRSADYWWQEFWRKWRNVWKWQLRYTSLVPPLKQPPPRHPAVHYSTCWYQFRETVCPKLSVNCTFRYQHSSAEHLRFSDSLKCVHMFIYLSM